MLPVGLEKNTCLARVAEREAEQEPGQETAAPNGVQIPGWFIISTV